ncbi:MAG TPA: aminoglycoside adenylyltransferase domain-containing protein [Solirubrobacter sp.]
MADVGGYLAALRGWLVSVLGEELIAAWQVGSGALGDFDPARSDIDVQAVSASRLPRVRLSALAAALTAVPCPVRGLEFVLYAREDLANTRFQLNLNTGPGMDHHEGYDPDAEERFWFVLDLAIARENAAPLYGPHPATVLPQLPREMLVAAHRRSLVWWAGYDGSQAIIAACRAWAWALEGRWLSKGDAAAWAVARLDDPAPVAKALARRADPAEPAPSAAEVDAILELVLAQI